jgi:hypothetical protein
MEPVRVILIRYPARARVNPRGIFLTHDTTCTNEMVKKDYL